MKITLLQQDIVWADPAANHKLAEEAILKAEKSDLYVLPEMFSTGFATQPEGIAEKDCASLKWMQEMANRMDAAIAGSVATEEDGKFYNRFYFVKPEIQKYRNTEFCNSESNVKACLDTAERRQNGQSQIQKTCATYYDKHHLFTYGGEHLRYTPGKERVVVEWRGVKFLLQVCYDLRFPIFARNEANGYDVALYVASWPTSRRGPWDILLKARAIENQCYVCGVDRTGEDPACKYNGGTTAIDPYGNVIAACPDGEVSSITIEIDKEKLEAFREKFPVLKDRDY